MVSPRLADVMQLLARRADLLGCLREGVQDKRELEETLGVSRSTLNRALNDLEENHLVVEQVDGYTVTPGGDVACRITQTWKPFSEALPVLAHLALDARLEPALFRGATVARADQPNPEAPIDHLETIVRAGSRVKGMSPVVLSRYVQLFYTQLVEQDVVVDVVLSEACFEYLLAEHYDEMSAAVGTDHCTFWQTGDTLPFGLAIVDDEHVWLGIHDEEGNVKGTIANSSDDAAEWALGVFRRFREDGQRVLVDGPLNNYSRN